jgi:hypothetical protein
MRRPAYEVEHERLRIIELDSKGDSAEQIRRRLGLAKWRVQQVLGKAGRHADFSEPLVVPKGVSRAPGVAKLNEADMGVNPLARTEDRKRGGSWRKFMRERAKADARVLAAGNPNWPKTKAEKRLRYMKSRHEFVRAVRASWSAKRTEPS